MTQSRIRRACCCCPSAAPKGPDDVMPFLRNVTRGRGIPDERLAEVAEHYQHFHGVSPINEQNRALIDALRAEFGAAASSCPSTGATATGSPTSPTRCGRCATTGCGARWSSPPARRRRTRRAGSTARTSPRRSAWRARAPRSWSSCGTSSTTRASSPPNADGVRAALGALPADVRDTARLVFTAHSIPAGMNDAVGTVAQRPVRKQQRETARLVAESVRGARRGVRPGVAVAVGAAAGARGSSRTSTTTSSARRARRRRRGRRARPASSPTTSRCCWDLDTEASETAEGWAWRSPGQPPPVRIRPSWSAICELVAERLDGAEPRALGDLGLCGIDCPAGCCPRARSAAGRPA